MAFLAVLTADGGVPLITRSSGEIKTKLPFATIGTLNGVHMFSRLREAELKRAVTPEEKILWREYHERLVLILITRNDACSDCHMSNLLDNIFAAMAMLIGLDLLLKQGEVMKLQKALVVCHPLLDHILSQMDKANITVSDLTCKIDCLLATDTHTLQECLYEFLDVADSLYGCLLIKGKVSVASKEWWTLTDQEKFLMCNYVNALPKVLSREVAIYLPTSSPQNSNRLVTLHLLRDVEVCVLCSEEPSLTTLEEEAPKIWKNSFDALKILSNLHPRNFPKAIELDKNILGVMLINTETNQTMCSVQPSSDSFVTLSKSDVLDELCKRQEALRTLYKLVIGTYLKKQCSNSDKNLMADNTCPIFDYGCCDFGDYEACEYYMCTDQKKCYVINEKAHQIYILYNNEIPQFAIRSVSHQTMKLLAEKNLFPQQ